jgi:hypothetical protein
VQDAAAAELGRELLPGEEALVDAVRRAVVEHALLPLLGRDARAPRGVHDDELAGDAARLAQEPLALAGKQVVVEVAREDAVELAVGERERQRVALLDVGGGTLRDLAVLLHRAEDLQDSRQLVGVLVERDDVGATAVHLERVPSGATAHVDDPVAGFQAQPVEVNGQHW